MSNILKCKKNTTIDEDSSLVLSCKKGDLQAFEMLVRKHQRKMFNIAYRITGMTEDAEETVQEAFLAAYRGIGRFREDSSFATWVTTITVNCAKNRLKQIQGRRRHESFSMNDPIRTEDDCIAMDPPSQEPSAYEELEKQDTRQKIETCIKALDKDFREVLVLRDMQDFSYEEIGAILKVALGTVKSRLSRARESVRECLKRKLGDLL